ncbi:MAG: NAD(P)-dependent oxidoreductase [Alphaproteobacteria bacterium]|nr:NAD(P)-dependent oxidoreductase [Alphaproteobacteria bacterium]
MKVGMIGLGGMGRPVAECILRAGFPLVVADLRQEPVAALTAAGASSAASPARVAELSDVVIASLPSNAASEEVALGPDGVLAGASQGDVYIDTSTISPEVIRRVAERAADSGIGVLDAPVSGGIRQRRDGDLTVMVGGEAADFERAEPVLRAFGSTVVHVGGIGAGATVKLVNNLIMACNAAAAIEGVLLGVKAGLDPRIIHEVVSVSTGGSRIFDNVVGRMLDTPSAPKPGTVAAQGLHTVSKDVRLAMDLAQSNGVPVPMGAAAAQIWLAAEARGLSRHEIWSLAEVLEELTGVRVAQR